MWCKEEAGARESEKERKKKKRKKYWKKEKERGRKSISILKTPPPDNRAEEITVDGYGVIIQATTVTLKGNKKEKCSVFSALVQVIGLEIMLSRIIIIRSTSRS